MRKILIAICLICISNTSFADKRTYANPSVETSDAVFAAWGVTKGLTRSDSSFSTDVSSQFEPIDVFYNTKAGTYGTNNEGSIVPIIAREIYEHGGKFCMTQVQAAWGSKTGKFIDYFTRTDGSYAYKCQTVCEAGYMGAGCATKGYKCDANVDYTTNLNNRGDGKFRKTSGEQNNRVTSSVEVFAYANGRKDYSTSFAWVLGVLKQNKHSLIVAPIKIKADTNVIKSAHSNGTKFVLCAPGYVIDASGEDCVQAEECTPGYVGACPNVIPSTDKFDPTEHEKVTTEKDASGKQCWYFRCSGDNGFEYEGSEKCVPCRNDLRQAVNERTGVCETCGQGKCFNQTTQKCGDCAHVVPNSRMVDSKECWRKSVLEEFWGCVLCDSSNPCYKRTANGYSCGTCD